MTGAEERLEAARGTLVRVTVGGFPTMARAKEADDAMTELVAAARAPIEAERDALREALEKWVHMTGTSNPRRREAEEDALIESTEALLFPQEVADEIARKTSEAWRLELLLQGPEPPSSEEFLTRETTLW